MGNKYFREPTIRTRYQQILANTVLKLAKEVDDGIFYSKRKDQLAFAEQRLDRRKGNLYLPWDDVRDKFSTIDKDVRNLYDEAERYRMGMAEFEGKGMPDPEMRFDSHNVLPNELRFTDHTQNELERMGGHNQSEEELEMPYSTGYVPMRQLSRMPLHLGPNLVEFILGGLAPGMSGRLIEAPGGYGKSTMWQYFGIMAAQHSLSHLSLWLKDPNNKKNIFNPSNYRERRFITFDSQRFSINRGIVGGSEAMYNRLDQVFETNAKTYRDIFVLVADEFASAMNPANTVSVQGGGRIGPRQEFEDRFKKLLEPGGQPGPFKLFCMYAPEDRRYLNGLFNSQMASRLQRKEVPEMTTSYIRDLISKALFSRGPYAGLIQAQGGIPINFASKGFKQAYTKPVVDELIDEMLRRFADFVIRIQPPPGRTTPPTVGAPRKIKLLVQFAANNAQARSANYPNVRMYQEEIDQIESQVKNYKEIRRKLEEDLAFLKQASYNKSLLKRAENEEEEDFSEEDTSISQLDTPGVQEPTETTETNQTPDASDSGEYGYDEKQQDIEKKEQEIKAVIQKIKLKRRKLTAIKLKLESISERLKNEYPDTKFLPDLSDIGWLKPIDVKNIKRNDLILTTPDDTGDDDEGVSAPDKIIEEGENIRVEDILED